MTTLVTGAFGCIGAWVVRGLLASGERPVVFDLGDDPWRVRMIAGFDAPRRAVTVRGDITDRESLGGVVRDHGIRRVIHLAAWQVRPTSLADGVAKTLDEFERLQKDGRLDRRELT
jgi:UDP-glucuronate 4-epimerase